MEARQERPPSTKPVKPRIGHPERSAARLRPGSGRRAPESAAEVTAWTAIGHACFSSGIRFVTAFKAVSTRNLREEFPARSSP